MEEEIYNRKKFNSNRRGESNGSEEDERREQKENWPRNARQFHSEKKDRSAWNFDHTADETLERSRYRDEDYLRLKEDARKKELE